MSTRVYVLLLLVLGLFVEVVTSRADPRKPRPPPRLCKPIFPAHTLAL